MANSNGDNKWFIRIVMSLMLVALPSMGLMLWNVSAEADRQNKADIEAVEQHIKEDLETKESHRKDVELIEIKFEFIKGQLKEIKDAVK